MLASLVLVVAPALVAALPQLYPFETIGGQKLRNAWQTTSFEFFIPRGQCSALIDKTLLNVCKENAGVVVTVHELNLEPARVYVRNLTHVEVFRRRWPWHDCQTLGSVPVYVSVYCKEDHRLAKRAAPDGPVALPPVPETL